MNREDPIPDPTVDIQARRYNKGSLEDKRIFLAREVPYTLFVNDEEILSMSTLPSNLKDLFVGFLVSEGVLYSPDEISHSLVDHANKLVSLEVNVPEDRLERLQRKGMLTSGCAGGMVFSVEADSIPGDPDREPMKLKCSSVIGRMRELDTYHGIYRLTRGVHAAAAADSAKTLITLEDLGRHNAVDKIVGHCFLNRMETSDKLLLTTGRITSELLIKATRSRFPVIISRSSASAMAAALAEQCSVDLVTYVRAERFNYFPFGGVDLIED